VSIRLVVLLLHAVADVLRSARGLRRRLLMKKPTTTHSRNPSFSPRSRNVQTTVFSPTYARLMQPQSCCSDRSSRSSRWWTTTTCVTSFPQGSQSSRPSLRCGPFSRATEKPSPLLGADFFEAFSADAEDARKNIIADIALAGPKNRRLASMKSRWLRFAGYVTFVSIIVAVGLKVVESLTRAH